MQSTDNPFLVSGGPFLRKGTENFEECKPEYVLPAAKEVLEYCETKLADVIGAESSLTARQQVIAIDELHLALERFHYTVHYIVSVAYTDEMQQVWNEAQALLTAFRTKLVTNSDLYHKLKKIKGADGLSEAFEHFIEREIQSMERAGASLDTAQRKKLIELDLELQKLCTAYATNLLKASQNFDLIVTDKQELSGLPDQALEAAAESAQGVGKKGYRFTLDLPSLLRVLTYAENRELREKLHRAFATRASEGEYANGDIVLSILRLRQEKAEMLGYQRFGDLILADRMAESAAEARSFVERMRRRVEPHLIREREELRAFASEQSGGQSFELQPWDVAFYEEKLKRQELDFDAEELRPYFSMDRVLGAAFTVAERVFGVEFEESSEYSTLHPTARVFVAKSNASGAFIGHCYVDLITRPEKRAGAWMNPFQSPCDRPEGAIAAVAAISGNMTPATSTRPSLLRHDEVCTVFHEFGHLLHGMLYQGELSSLGGLSVEWDFVELPSQLLENWCWDRDFLRQFALHYETDEPIPEVLVDKLLQTRTYRHAGFWMRQLGQAELDFALHDEFLRETKNKPVEAEQLFRFARAKLDRYSFVPVPYSTVPTNFGHLFSDPVGYACAYYSYKWAEVLEADAFSQFEEHGLFNNQISSRLTHEIFQRGSERAARETFRAFMGRDLEPEALLRRDGF